MATEFFIQRPTITPTIYVYELIGVASHKGYIKIGYTERDVATRNKEQLHTAAVPFKILYQESAMREDCSIFTDKDIHRVLERRGFSRSLRTSIDRVKRLTVQLPPIDKQREIAEKVFEYENLIAEDMLKLTELDKER